ncbi:MAG: DUF1772 domain-containing protein [Jatrophihabitans sp.]|uniref:DUF1772 domain-containing protein n=1 Tax=Jatrophihabitans sp. TaxID=1932789 RepID=UPI003F8153CD
MLGALLVAATAAYAGFQWTIRLVVYPQFATVPREAFVRYEARHQGLVSIAVGPLFVLDGAACIAAFVHGPRWPSAAAGACLAVILLLTAFGAVPQHRALSSGFDAAVHRRLLLVDSLRLGLALGAVGAAVWFAAG